MVCELAIEAKIYRECMKNYPFVLGAQALRMIDLAALLRRHRQRRRARHALRHRFDRAERQAGLSPPRARSRSMLADGDRVAFYQLRTILEGVVARGTAALDEAATPASSAARPAPPTTRTTPGSSASPATSPSRSGSATTTPAASARSATARPAASVAVPIVEPIIQARLAHPRTEDAAAAAVGRGRAPAQGDADRRATPARRSAPARDAFHGIFPASTATRLRDTQHALVDRRRASPRSEPRPAASETASSRRGRARGAGRIARVHGTAPRSLRELFGSVKATVYTNRPRSYGLNVVQRASTRVGVIAMWMQSVRRYRCWCSRPRSRSPARRNSRS